MHLLDNVIWRALTTSQAHLTTRNHCSGKFLAEVSILGALSQPSAEAYESLAALLRSDERVGLLLDTTPEPLLPTWKLVTACPLLQMVHEDAISPQNVQRPEFLRLGEPDVPEMLALTRLTKPGPFGKRTHEMG